MKEGSRGARAPVSVGAPLCRSSPRSDNRPEFEGCIPYSWLRSASGAFGKARSGPPWGPPRRFCVSARFFGNNAGGPLKPSDAGLLAAARRGVKGFAGRESEEPIGPLKYLVAVSNFARGGMRQGLEGAFREASRQINCGARKIAARPREAISIGAGAR